MAIETVTEAERLATLAALRLLDTGPEPQFEAIVRAAAHGFGAPSAAISLVNDRRQWFKARLGLESPDTPLTESICAHAIRSDEVMVVPDLSRDERFAGMDCVAGTPGFRFYAGAPLRMGNGARLGTLCIIDVEPREGLADADRAYLELLARRTVSAFEIRREMLARMSARHDVGDEVWLEQAATLLNRASVTLEQVGATQPLAHLEHVIALVDGMRQPTHA